MTSNIEIDNQEKLMKFKTILPHPSYISGFIDGDGCIFIRKIKDGYQSGFTISQCRTNILQIIRYHFGGSITTSNKRSNKTVNIMDEDDTFFHKYNVRNQYNLIIRGNEYNVLLEHLQNTFIIKELQYQSLLKFSKSSTPQEKEELYIKCKELNMEHNLSSQYLARLNIEYIAGLFDAEGCVYINKNNHNKFYLSISQKSHPIILTEIIKFIGYGNINSHKYIIYNKPDCLNLMSLIKPHLIVKYNQVVAFETFLITSDVKIKQEMYKICNEEKHIIENFIDKEEHSKDSYLQTIQLREMKQRICNQIKLKEFYKNKSESMKGEKNHNFGKHFSSETKKKMSISIRNAKGGISDDVIIQVREYIKQGYKNVEIQEMLSLSRNSVTQIKSGKMVCRTEENPVITSLTQEEINLSKRKVVPQEIIIILEKYVENMKPTQILNYLNENYHNSTATIDIIKNIKRSLKDNKTIIYESELSKEKYKQYLELIEKLHQITTN